jgi:hypothetical protein
MTMHIGRAAGRTKRLRGAALAAAAGMVLAVGAGCGSGGGQGVRGGWSQPVTILPAAGVPVALLATNLRGDLLATWFPGPRSQGIAFAERPAGGRWSAPGVLWRHRPFKVIDLDTALDGQGRATAAWTVGDHNTQVLVTATRAPGGRWSAPVALTSDESEPGLAVNGRGDAVLAWIGSDPADHAREVVQASFRRAGGRFSDPVTIAAGHLNWPPSVAIDARGDAAVTWNQEEPRGPFPGPIFVAERPAGGGWSAPRRLSGRQERTYSPVIAMSGRGSAVVAWTRMNKRDDRQVGVVATVRSPDGRWSPPQRVSSARDGQPALALDSDGNATMAWVRWDRPVTRVEVSTRPAGGSWSAPTQLARGDSQPAPRGGSLPSLPPDPGLGGVQVVAGRSGTAAVAWVRLKPQQVEAAVERAGRWSAPAVLSTKGTAAGGLISLAAGPSGSVAATWAAQPWPKTVIQTSVFK